MNTQMIGKNSMKHHYLKNKVKLDLLTEIDMLLMVEKGNRGGMCHVIHRFVKATNKYMKDYDKNKEFSYLNYWDVSNLYEQATSQKVPADDFTWVENMPQVIKDFTENYNEERDGRYLFEVYNKHPEKVHHLHNDLPFLPKRMKIGKVEKLLANLNDKK